MKVHGLKPVGNSDVSTIKSLLPCPWCGLEPVWAWDEYDWHTVSCMNPKCPVGPCVGGKTCRQDAEEAWNNRPEKKGDET